MAPYMHSAQLYDCTCIGGYVIQTCKSCGGHARSSAECKPCAGTGSVRVPCPKNHYNSNSNVFADATFASVTRDGEIGGHPCDDEWQTCPDCAGGRSCPECETCGGTGVVNSCTNSHLSGRSLATGDATLARIISYGHLQSPPYLGH